MPNKYYTSKIFLPPRCFCLLSYVWVEHCHLPHPLSHSWLHNILLQHGPAHRHRQQHLATEPRHKRQRCRPSQPLDPHHHKHHHSYLSPCTILQTLLLQQTFTLRIQRQYITGNNHEKKEHRTSKDNQSHHNEAPPPDLHPSHYNHN